MKLAILLLGAAVLHAQEPAPNSLKLLAISDAAMVASDVGDILSSRGLYELNPLVGRGPFGSGSV